MYERKRDRHALDRRSVWLVAGLALATGLAAGSVARALPLGTVEVISGPDGCKGGECWELEVTCKKLEEPATATLRVREPPSSAMPRGTILFTTGGGGRQLWVSAYGRPARKALSELQRDGFRTVELEWHQRWLNGAPGALEGQHKLACRPATVAHWIYDNLHDGEALPYCATGNSGGSAQIAYTMSHYKGKKIFSAIVPSGGPPMGRIDRGCLEEQDPDVAGPMIYGDGSRQTIDFSFGFYEQDGPCVNSDESFRRKLKKASVAARKKKKYVFKNTLVWFVFGAEDTSSAVGQGLLFFDKLEKAGTPLLGMSVAPNTPHPVPSTQDGADMIRDLLLEGCVLWDGVDDGDGDE